MEKLPKRSVFFISDGTGITAETLGHSLLAQFPEEHFRQIRLPFIDSIEKASDCARKLRTARQLDGQRPIVVSTLVNANTIAVLRQEDAFFVSFLEQFIGPLEVELGISASHTVGRFHGIAESADYQSRIEAINFTLAHDDGQSNLKLEQAEVILVGVSRSGKTPTSLYLAMQFGVKAANYPLIPEDFERQHLPTDLTRHHGKLYGLTISPERLAEVRQERRPNSVYASLENCRYEIEAAQRLMKINGISYIDSTSRSIEEISAKILQEIGVYHNQA